MYDSRVSLKFTDVSSFEEDLPDEFCNWIGTRLQAIPFHIPLCRVLCKNSATTLKSLIARKLRDRDIVSAVTKAMFEEYVIKLSAKRPMWSVCQKRRIYADLSDIISDRIECTSIC